jgi:hypothetical protein
MTSKPRAISSLGRTLFANGSRTTWSLWNMSWVSSILWTFLLRKYGMAYITLGFGIHLWLDLPISSTLLSWKCTMPTSIYKILLLLLRLKFTYLQDAHCSSTCLDWICFANWSLPSLTFLVLAITYSNVLMVLSLWASHDTLLASHQLLFGSLPLLSQEFLGESTKFCSFPVVFLFWCMDGGSLACL